MTVGCHLPYRKVWAVDFEFTAPPGERPAPLCVVARDLHTGRLVRRWLAGGCVTDGRPADGRPPPASAVERVLAVARGEARATDVGGGRRVARTAGRLRVEGH